MTVVQEQASATLQSSPPRRIRRGPAAIVLVVALVVAGAVWWEFNPHTLPATGDEVGARGQIGRAAYFDTAIADQANSSRAIDVRSVRPVIATNTAAASVGVLLCHTLPTATDRLGAAYDLASVCTSVSAFRPGSIPLNGRREQIILVVTPNARGTVRIAGVDVTYRDGIRRGHQRTGVNTVVDVP